MVSLCLYLFLGTQAERSNPLWLARIIQGMGRCLERLRKDQKSVLATKTTLQIINTILRYIQCMATI